MEISSFLMSSDRGFFIDLKDKLAAVSITPSGDVIFAQGDGPNRLNNLALANDSVIGIELIRGEGRASIIIRYGKGTVPKTLNLGFTDDTESAAHWVERVNKIYEQNRKSIKAKCEGFRVGKFFTQPVVHDVISEKKNQVLAGDYLFSGGELPPYDHLQPWEEYYINRTITNLKEYTGFADEIETVCLHRTPHNYKWFNERVKYNANYYSFRITQPLELIFDREQRHDSIGVIPFGITNYFAMLYIGKQKPAAHFSVHPREPVTDSFGEWIKLLSQAMPGGSSILLCTPTNQSVEYSIMNMQLQGLIDINQLESQPYVGNLATWLYSNFNRGIIACDIGVAYQIISYMNKNRMPGAQDVDFSLVPYEQAIPIGLCYRVDDPEWGSICHRSLLETLHTKNEKVVESLEEAKARAKRIGIELLAAA